MAAVVATASAVLASSSREIWPLVTDTDRTNRLLLGDAVEYRAVEPQSESRSQGTAARFVGRTKVAGFALEYEEDPFEWVENERFGVVRRMRGGPLRSYAYTVRLAALPSGGTRVDIELRVELRVWFLRPLAQLQARRVVDGMIGLARQLDTHLRAKTPSPYAQPVAPVNEGQLARATAELRGRGLDPAALDRVLEIVRRGPDADVVRMRPFEIAHDENLDERAVLRVFLHAVTTGVCELRWALVCPSCRTASDQVTSLADLPKDGHCQLCDLTFGLDLDRAVEATFRPHPSVRDVPEKMFCVGGPWRTPHVVVQQNLAPGVSSEVAAPREAGRYRLFARGGAVAMVDVRAGAALEAHVRLGEAGFSAPELTVAPAGRVVVGSELGEPTHVKVEHLGYATLAATAHYVTTMSEFRRLFSKELLKASTPLRVASCAILFSDLTGSTALYTSAGDAAAFRFVDDHFDVLRAAITARGGTVVKTMGDAVMAAFVDEASCAGAALDCLAEFEKFRKNHAHGPLTGLKVGLFAGPCYVVTANDAIDYFGQTVNCASRVQHLADSGQIVLEGAAFDHLPEAERARMDVVERFSAQVKGVAAPLHLIRASLTAP
jgi:class 3 adenylate cyclase